MFDPNYNPSIYSASKIWHNTKWTEMRDKYGFNVIARWINLPCGEKGNQTGAKLLTPAEKTELWIECQYDTCTADMTTVYAEKGDNQRGAVCEMGMALGAQFVLGYPKPIYVIGDCETFQVSGDSDVAFMHHPMIHRIHTKLFADGSYDYREGYKIARQHYLENYHTPENVFRKTGFISESITGGFGGVHKPAVIDPAKTVRTI